MRLSLFILSASTDKLLVDGNSKKNTVSLYKKTLDEGLKGKGRRNVKRDSRTSSPTVFSRRSSDSKSQASLGVKASTLTRIQLIAKFLFRIDFAPFFA